LRGPTSKGREGKGEGEEKEERGKEVKGEGEGEGREGGRLRHSFWVMDALEYMSSLYSFYRAMHVVQSAVLLYKSSVRLSVCSSVRNVDVPCAHKLD